MDSFDATERKFLNKLPPLPQFLAPDRPLSGFWLAKAGIHPNQDAMKSLKTLVALFLSSAALLTAQDEDGFHELLNGKDLTGWKVNENPDSFKVVDGELVALGERSHLFYVGSVGGAKFTDFEAKLVILTKPSANAGFYFHTEFQDEGWPKKGYEAQINATHKDPKKTGSLYAVENVMDIAPHKDNEWFEYHIIVKGSRIIIKVNGETTVDYTEPEGGPVIEGPFDRKLSSGTIAIQCHDPGSEVHFKSIKVKPL